MAQLEGVNLEKLQGGLGRIAKSMDGHLALIVKTVTDVDVDAAIAGNGEGLRLTSLFAAESIGITASLDANEGINLHGQIVDFFRLAPAGTLYLFNDSTPANIVSFLKARPEIKGYAVQEDRLTVIDGAEVTQESYLAEHQLNVVDVLAAENRFIDFGILGINGFTIADATDLRALECPNMSISIVSGKPDSLANLGALLGMIAVRKVNENPASVNIQNKPMEARGTRDYPLTDVNKGLWLQAYLTDGTTIKSLASAELTDLDTKGYIAAASYQEYEGVFFTNSHTAIDKASDFAYIENNRVWNKAARIIRLTLIPEVKGVVKKDPTSGFIKSTTASRWTSLGRAALEQMVAVDEISGFDFLIDHKQVVNSDAPVKAKALIVADGIVHEFEIALGLTNSI